MAPYCWLLKNPRRTDWRPATLRFDVAGVRLKPFFETYGRHSVCLRVSFR